jgi:hypothetical protein
MFVGVKACVTENRPALAALKIYEKSAGCA